MKYANESTKGATLESEDKEGEYITVGPGNIETTKSVNNKEPQPAWIADKAKEFGSLFYGLSEKVDFAALLVAVIGYIVISSFGGMKSVGEFWRYLIFLFLAFVLYKVVNFKGITISVDNKAKIYIGIIALLVATLLISNWKLVSWTFNQLNSNLEIPKTEVQPSK